MKAITSQELAEHKTKNSCWVAINGKVYDVTEFLPEHPGGVKVIERLAGKDATKAFNKFHDPDVLNELPKEALKGEFKAVDQASTSKESVPTKSITEKQAARADSTTADSTVSNPSTEPRPKKLPPLSHVLNLNEFESLAKSQLDAPSWAYYFSGSDDLVTKNFNNTVFSKVFFKPRIFVDVAEVSTESRLFDIPTGLPIFVSPAAMARLAHPTGEVGIANACAKKRIVQMISNNSSIPFDKVVAQAADPKQVFYFQLYVQNDRAKSEAMLSRVFRTGRCKGVVLTLDAPWPGKREEDERVKNLESGEEEEEEEEEEEPSKDVRDNLDAAKQAKGGLGKALFAGTSASLVWDDLKWLKSQVPADAKIILKGLQSVDDVKLAAANPLVDGVIISNHGGRALDYAPAPLVVLEEVRALAPECFNSIEVFIDGGIKRGTDVVKALCLGAKQVGLGRAVLYGLTGYGEKGVLRTLTILQEEIETAMRLLGVTTLDQLGPHLVNTRQLDLLADIPASRL